MVLKEARAVPKLPPEPEERSQFKRILKQNEMDKGQE
jgi:hypothetical protein